MFKKITAFIVVFIFVLVLAACGKAPANNAVKTGVAYGITHKDYVGVVTVQVKGEEVTNVSVEEYFLPNTWAKIQKLEIDEVPADVVVDGASWYGKHLVIGDKHFTGELRSEPLVIDGVTYAKQSIKYSAEGVNDLYTWLRTSEENRKWYVEAIENGDVFVADADFEASEYVTASALNDDGVLGFTKSTTGYWKGNENQLGWSGNMNENNKALTGTKMDVSLDNIEKNENNYWVIGDIVSGATLIDFKDYYTIAQAAYNKAE